MAGKNKQPAVGREGEGFSEGVILKLRFQSLSDKKKKKENERKHPNKELLHVLGILV